MKDKNRVRLILRLARFHFLLLGFLLYLAGYLLAMAYGAQLHTIKFLFGYLVFGLAHLSVSFSNDYFDRIADKNSKRTIFSGGSKVLVEHPEMERLSLRISIFLLAASFFGAAFLTIVFDYSLWLLLFVLMGGLLGWFYTAPPLKLAYRGLGEIATMFAVGFLMPGVGYFIASGTIDLFFIPWVFPFGCYGLFFIITVELPDLEVDKYSGKANLVVRWGRRKSKAIYLGATALGSISLAMLDRLKLAGEVPLWLAILISLVLLFAASINFIFDSEDRNILVREVTVNIFLMIIFIVSFNFILLNKILN